MAWHACCGLPVVGFSEPVVSRWTDFRILMCDARQHFSRCLINILISMTLQELNSTVEIIPADAKLAVVKRPN